MKILSDLARVKELVKIKSKCLTLKLVLCIGGCSFFEKQSKTTTTKTKQNKTNKQKANKKKKEKKLEKMDKEPLEDYLKQLIVSCACQNY